MIDVSMPSTYSVYMPTEEKNVLLSVRERSFHARARRTFTVRYSPITPITA